MPSNLVAHEQPISKIFSDDYAFTIPGFQRPYAWTSEQAGDLLDDVVAFLNAQNGDLEGMPPYFLGSIVLRKSEDAPDSDVVDGQQRLTTLMLLLSAIRANISSADAVAAITQLIYQKGNQILGTPDRFRLSLRERDQEFFKKYVQQEGGFQTLIQLNDVPSDSQRNICENARLFDASLKTLSESERLRLAKFVATRCFLVVVATPDLDSAYRIFSVLNSRGLDLSPTDILKARIIGDIKGAERDAYTKKWEDTEDLEHVSAGLNRGFPNVCGFGSLMALIRDEGAIDAETMFSGFARARAGSGGSGSVAARGGGIL